MPVPHDRHPIIARRLHKDDVYDRLLTAIVTGDLPAGARLRDVELEAWSGVSRTPVRSALVRLERVGLVESGPHRSTSVCRPRASVVPDLVSALCALWRELPRQGEGLFAPHAVDENRRLVGRCLAASAALRGSPDPGVADSRAVVDAAFAVADRLAGGAVPEVVERLVLDLGARLHHQAALLGHRLDTGPLTACLVQVDAAVLAGDPRLLRSALDELARRTVAGRAGLVVRRSPWWSR